MLFLISRLSQQSEHVALITLNARLVKGIHSQQITADAAGKFKEIE